MNIEDYIAPDGLGKLSVDDKRDSFDPAYPATVQNENGVLFLAEMLLQLKLNGYDISIHRARAWQTLDMLKVEGAWCFNRRPADRNLHNSHDNMIGIVILCQLFGFSDVLYNIWLWGNLHSVGPFRSYNNLEPRRVLDPKTWLLPRDTALIDLAVWNRISPLQWFWLVLSVFTKSKHKRMMRLRMESVKMSAHRSFLAGILTYWFKKWGGYPRFAHECAQYYKDPYHPYRLLTAEYASTHP